MSVVGLINDPNAVIEGSIRYKGLRSSSGCRSARCAQSAATEIGMVFQDPMTSLTRSSAWAGRSPRRSGRTVPSSARGAHNRAIELLDAVGIPHPAAAVGHYPPPVLGGMRQRG